MTNQQGGAGTVLGCWVSKALPMVTTAQYHPGCAHGGAGHARRVAQHNVPSDGHAC